MTVKKAMSVRYWPEDERLCKRFIAHDAASHSNARHLSISIKKGKAGTTTLDLAMALLVKFNFPHNEMIGRMP
jgi:DNA repair protein RadC